MYCMNYVIKQGDTLYSISRHFSIPLDAIIKANPMVNVYNLMADDTLSIPASVPQNNYVHYTTYLVEDDDTLGSVLDEQGINLADLMNFNDLHEIYLQPGSTLQVPIIDEGEDDITL